MKKFYVYVSYKVKPDFVDDYFSLMDQVKAKTLAAGASDYHVCRATEKDNLFMEVIQTKSQEEYERIEDAQAEGDWPELFKKLNDFIDGGIGNAKFEYFQEVI